MKKDAQSKELIRTSQSWDGVELPDYLSAAVCAAPGVVETFHETSLLGNFICPHISKNMYFCRRKSQFANINQSK